MEIISYYAYYESSIGSKGINHSVKYKNVSNRTIVAIQFGLVSYSVWNEFLDKLLGVTIQNIPPGETTYNGSWTTSLVSSDFTFWTGVSYVSMVRFDNGEIWTANKEDITASLQYIENNFDILIPTSK